MLSEVRDIEKNFPEWYSPKDPKNHYNSLPRGWREITQQEFTHQFELTSITHMEFRQAQLKKDECFANIHLFYHDGPEGLALVPVSENAGYIRHRYFAFGCKHDWKGVSREGLALLAKKFPKLAKVQGTWGRCCNNYVCLKCGRYDFQDSSD